ncbi:sugar 3,4-ketoisomerase [Clostridium coskatii]|uniref:TDP-4-oxo-6-deoxy-alpha-D-glucose-3, 4-oxoisomerase n=1 Tax=Clostridium coskatii TaxID=1705578 RepID=A0A170NNZ6_9CLOT|nr:FdtA/QdtA family cupin domain-containing protein [Clostridium coskatii]OAA94208.1 TDP-4-oxo-6-deoxy-alpha-D-glucose-3,4-oxoisomerase [Clostridium coskatii]OBR90924.1 TDP-4-oxo-6-deoxy-alpha-D-glucose-3,4-oxoisomerase [Clostridium coskatii]
MYNCTLLKFKDILSKYGHLTPIEGFYDVPYEIKRVFYIYGVPQGNARGYHAHKKTYQTLICVKGSLKVKVKTPNDEEIFVLDNPDKGLMIGPMIWAEQFDYSEDAVLLVLTSEYFDENDYIRNYDIYLEEAKKRF